MASREAHLSTPNGASTRCHCAVCDQMFFISMLPSLSMPLPSNHYLLKIHFNLPRNIRYTIPFPIPPERAIQELEVLANPAEQAYPGKQASTSTTRSHHASQLFWSVSQLFWSVRSRQCLLFGLDSQPVVVCFCCLVCFFGATANQPDSSNKDQCKV